MSTLTARMRTTAPFAPRQAPEADSPTTISGFELDVQSGASSPALGQHTPVSGEASIVNHLDEQAVLMPSQCCCEALEARIEQLLEENELQAQELRDLHNKRRERKERKSKEKKAVLRTEIMRELLRFMTAVLVPLPEGSPARFVVMAVETFSLMQRVPAS
jgi:hypothetical protein